MRSGMAAQGLNAREPGVTERGYQRRLNLSVDDERPVSTLTLKDRSDSFRERRSSA